VLRNVWPTMFAYQFVVRLETAPALLDPLPESTDA
jgi:hypothetical protein